MKIFSCLFAFHLLVKFLYQILITKFTKLWLNSNINFNFFNVLYFVECDDCPQFLVALPLIIYFFTIPLLLTFILISLSAMKILPNLAHFKKTGNLWFIGGRSTVERPYSLDLRCVCLFICIPTYYSYLN